MRSPSRLYAWLTGLAVWSARAGCTEDELRERMDRLSFETDTRRLGIRMTGFLRDRLRRQWLKYRE